MEIKDKKELYKLVAYLTMGDGGVYYAGKHCRFVLNMVKKNSDFVEYAKSILENVTPVTVREVNDNREGRQESLCLSTRTHPVFTQMRDQIYVDSYKSLSPHYLKAMDWESLAILFMSDGSLYTDRPEDSNKGLVNISYSVSLNMKRLSYGDQELLRQTLVSNLGLMWNIVRAGKYFYLRMRNSCLDTFYNNITEHILPSFQYKVPEKFRM